MESLPSTEFRKRFAKLTDVTLVTVNGHPIGVWKPLRPEVGEDWARRTSEQFRQGLEASVVK